jgi:uncharacterized protein YqgC (DUF456 family)
MDAFGQIALNTLVIAVMAVGLLLAAIPEIPGLTIIWAAVLVWGIANGITGWGILVFVLITILMLVGGVIDNLLMGAGARKSGASWWAIIVALVAGVLGSLLFSPIGGLLLALAALFVFEFYRVKDWRKALRSTRDMALGCGWASIARFGMGAIMIVLWLLWAFVIAR